MEEEEEQEEEEERRQNSAKTSKFDEGFSSSEHKLRSSL